MRVNFNPRLWLIIWLGLGAAVTLYVILASALSGNGTNFDRERRETPSSRLSDPNLQVGGMADFVYAASERLAPTAEFQRDGDQVTLGDFRGRTVLVNFWATWCAPCLKELPSLDALEAEMGGDDFAVIAVAADPKGPETARAFLDRLGLEHLKLYADPGLDLVIASGGSNVLPLSILYDADGREIGRLVGEANWQSAEAKALISAAIASSRH